MSTSPDIPKELPGDEPDDVLFGSIYGLRSIELNRPKKLNSLNGSMARKIFPRLKVWRIHSSNFGWTLKGCAHRNGKSRSLQTSSSSRELEARLSALEVMLLLSHYRMRRGWRDSVHRQTSSDSNTVLTIQSPRTLSL